MKNIILLSILISLSSAFAQYQGSRPMQKAATQRTQAARVPTNPCPQKYPNIDPSCQQVCQACYAAGFIVGEANIGDGFWYDCVIPLVANKAPSKPPTANGPKIPANMQSAGTTCNSKSPNFWTRK